MNQKPEPRVHLCMFGVSFTSLFMLENFPSITGKSLASVDFDNGCLIVKFNSITGNLLNQTNKRSNYRRINSKDVVKRFRELNGLDGDFTVDLNFKVQGNEVICWYGER